MYRIFYIYSSVDGHLGETEHFERQLKDNCVCGGGEGE